MEEYRNYHKSLFQKLEENEREYEREIEENGCKSEDYRITEKNK